MKTFKKLSLIAATFGVLTITTPLVLTSCNGDSGDGKNPDDGGGDQTQKYSISLSSHQNDITLSSNSVAEGEQVSLTWKGNSDAIVSYSYKDEDGTKIEISNNTFVMPNYNITIDVVVKYKINIQVENAVFYLTDSGDNIPNDTNIMIEENSTLNYKVEVNDGYQLTSIDIYDKNNQKIDILSNNLTGSYKMTKNENITLKVSCQKVYVNHSITLNSHNDKIQLSKQEAKYNEKVTITWNGNKDAKVTYYLVDQTGNRTAISGSEFTMPDHQVSIDVKVEYKVIVRVNSGGTVNINNQNYNDEDYLYVEENSEFSYTLTPDNERKLKKLTATQNGTTTELDVKTLTGKYSLKNDGQIEFNVEFGKTVTTIVKDVASILVNSMKLFNLYDVIPEVFDENNLVGKDGNKINITEDQYNSTFMNVSEIPVYGIGAQLNQFLNASGLIMNIVNIAKPIYNSAATIGELWQKFFDKDSDKGTNYEASTDNGGVKFKISLTDTDIRIMLKGGSANIDIHKDLDTNYTTTRFQISDANSMKIVDNGNTVKIGLRALGAQRMMLTFDRSNANETIGTLYNFYGIDGEDEGKDIGKTTMSVIKITDDYVSVIGKKGDFLSWSKQNRNIEMYNTKTGKFIGSQVVESNGVKLYNTNWYPLSSINGLNNIKIVKYSSTTSNGEKYINNSTKKFDNGRTGIIGSRQYEFEKKKVSVYLNENGKIKEQKIQIPLFFMQDEYEKDSSKGFTELNKNNSSNLLNGISTTILNRRDSDAIELKARYELLNLEEDKNKEVIDFVGNADIWFQLPPYQS